MNTLQILGICKEIYRDLRGKKVYTEPDQAILNCIIRLYNITEIDWEEVKSLWIEYLIKGSLSIPAAIQIARQRIA